MSGVVTRELEAWAFPRLLGSAGWEEAAQSGSVQEKFPCAAAREVCEPKVPHGVGGSITDAHEGADGNHHAERDVESAEKLPS